MGTSHWAKAAVDNQNSLEAGSPIARTRLKQLEAILRQLHLNIKFLASHSPLPPLTQSHPATLSADNIDIWIVLLCP